MFSRFTKRSLLGRMVPALLVLGALFFSSCDLGGNEDFGYIPEGTWSSVWAGNTGIDTYTISSTTLTYTSTPTGDTSSGWSGTIRGAVDFSETAGVLIIQYTNPPTGDWSGHAEDMGYTGVYYSAHSAASTKFADAWLPGDPYSTERAEAVSLSAAYALFTEGNVGDHVSIWGTYTSTSTP
jgi:hypothetical protein